MTEAEFLCHRIGILINGKFVCFGSNQHLKDKYGDGYRVKIKLCKQNGEEINGLFINKFENAKKLLENQADTLVFQIDNSSFSFYKAFSFLEDELKSKAMIEDFSIIQCSLEQIFIYFSRFQHNVEN